MKQLILSILFSTIGYISVAQTLDDLEFGTDTTFEVVTWNIEWFPKNGQITVNYVKQIIENLDVDLLAIQEVDDIDAFQTMVDGIDGYEAFYESGWFAGLAYIYNSNTIVVNDIYEIYTTYPYWSPFPRSPVVINLTFMGESFIVMNNHFKCCGDGILDLSNDDDEEYRRLEASSLLKEYIDSYMPNYRVIVVGDLNDILTDNTSNNVFQPFIDDSDNYKFADMAIAEGSSSGWSYPSWPSHLDHALITDEMFNELENAGSAIEVIKVDEYLSGGWSTYDTNISDHRPVGLKIKPELGTGINIESLSEINIQTYPNPFKDITNIFFSSALDCSEMEIYDMKGQKVHSIEIPAGKNSVIWNAENFPRGIYFTKLLIDKTTVAVTKLVLMK